MSLRKNIYTEKNFFWISGSSMLPAYKEGELISGKPFDGVAKKGRCYGFFHYDGRLFHRFVGFKNGLAVFIGDNSFYYQAVNPQAIFFEVDKKEPLLYILTVRLFNACFYPLRKKSFCMRLRVAMLKFFLNIILK